MIKYLLLILAVCWEVYWKYIALFHCAKHDNKKWFFAIMVINSIGLLPIYYLHKNNYFNE